MRTGRGSYWRWLMAVAVVLEAGQHALGQQAEPWATLKGHKGVVKALAFSPDGRTLASASWDGTVKLWDVAGGKERVALKHPGRVWAIAFAPRGKLLASGGDGGAVWLWDAAGRARGSKVGEGVVVSLSFSPDGTTLAVGGAVGKEAGGLRLWDVRQGRERLALRRHAAVLHSVSCSADGRMVAAVDGRGLVTLWEAVTGGVRATLRGHWRFAWSVTFLPGRDLLASGGGDGTVRLWDVRARKERAVLKGHNGNVRGLAATRKVLASTSDDYTVRLWDVAAQKQLLVLRPGKPLWSVAFSPDGKLLAAGDQDGAIRLWSVPKLLAHKGTK